MPEVIFFHIKKKLFVSYHGDILVQKLKYVAYTFGIPAMNTKVDVVTELAFGSNDLSVC